MKNIVLKTSLALIAIAAWILSACATIFAIKIAMPGTTSLLSCALGVLFEVSKSTFIFCAWECYKQSKIALARAFLCLSFCLVLVSVLGSFCYIVDTSSTVQKQNTIKTREEELLIGDSSKIHLESAIAAINSDFSNGYKTRAQSHLETLNKTLELKRSMLEDATRLRQAREAAAVQQPQHIIYAQKILGASARKIDIGFALFCAILLESISAISVTALCRIDSKRDSLKMRITPMPKKEDAKKEDAAQNDIDGELLERAIEAAKRGEKMTYANLRMLLRCNQNKLPPLMLKLKQMQVV